MLEHAPQPATSSTSETAAPDRTTRGPLSRRVTLVLGVVAAAVVVALAIVLARVFLFHTAAGASFLKAFPGQSELPAWAPVGQPLWAQWQHWLNAFFMVLVIKTGWTIRRNPRPSGSWLARNSRRRITLEQFIHLLLDVFWLANGVIFWVLLFATRQWVRVVPVHWDVFPNALSAALQYASLNWPTEDGWANYNALQLLAYFVTIFIAAPLAAVTGYRMSPLWPKKNQRLSRLFPNDLARRLHYPVMLYFVVFVVVHVTLVLATGALRNLNHMFWGSDSTGSWAGFWMFVLGIAAIVAAVIALRPSVVRWLGSLLGKVG
ncbi:MAG: cytochrome b/b6 domain-containing protein [Microbacteriaceae bacterium]|nr:cytochrome b/b6 domain-containing protein [Microbacteriaceae bacterium]MCL2795607.1 cytochrome b/b6 domain-containing protein [Microbacteriaceae bacterium]